MINIIPSIGMAVRRLLQFVSSISVSIFGENLAFIFRDTLIIDQKCDQSCGITERDQNKIFNSTLC